MIHVNRANLILEIFDTYKNRTREEILENLNIAIALGRDRRMPVDRYVALPEVTNRSKHSVMSWFNREHKKIPLIDLCMIADYLNYNLFAFFNTENFGKKTKGDFLLANEIANSKYPPDSARIFIKASKLQYDTDKDIIVDNLEKYFGYTKDMKMHHSSERQNKIMGICNCNKHTYISWFNRSRKNVRVPLASLCKLANAAEIDVFDMFRC